MTATVNPADHPLVLTRTLDAPRALVWQAFTELDHLRHWWGPKGFALTNCTLDFRPGGMFHYCMRSPNGQEMWGRFSYREIDAPDRIVFTSSFSDPTGAVTRAPFSAQFPLEVLNVWTFSESDGRTTIRMTGAPHEASAEEQAFFHDMHESMNQGFNGTFNQFAAYLEEIKTGAAR